MIYIDSKKKIGKIILNEQTITKNLEDHMHNSLVTTLKRGKTLEEEKLRQLQNVPSRSSAAFGQT